MPLNDLNHGKNYISMMGQSKLLLKPEKLHLLINSLNDYRRKNFQIKNINY